MVLFSDPDVALKSALLSVDLAREAADEEQLALALNAVGNAQVSLGQYEQAASSYEQSTEIYDRINPETAAILRINLANVLMNFDESQLDRAQSLLDQALAVTQRSGKKGLEGIILGNMARLAHTQGRKDDAYALSRKSVDIARTLGARQQEAVWLYWLGVYSTELGRRDEAASVLREAIVICRDIISDDPVHLTGCLEAVLMFVASDGRLLDAARIHGFIESFRRDRGLTRAPLLQTRYDDVLSGVRTGLGETAFEDSAAAGSKRTAEQLLDEAAEMIASQPT
jgi:tetratricopeptide (TPR) repeat protein